MSVLWEDHRNHDHDVEQLAAPKPDAFNPQLDACNEDDQLFMYTVILSIACLTVLGLFVWIAVGLVSDAGYVQ